MSLQSRALFITGLGGLLFAGCQAEVGEPTSSSGSSRLEIFEQQAVSDARAEYASLPLEERAQLWEEQIDRWLSGVLTGTERNWLESVRGNLEQTLSLDQQGFEKLEKDATDALGERRARELFGTLGNPRVRSNYQVRQALSGGGQMCTDRWGCNNECTCQFVNGACIYEYCGGCTPTSGGCGLFWQQPCTGISGYMKVYSCDSSSG